MMIQDNREHFLDEEFLGEGGSVTYRVAFRLGDARDWWRTE